MYIRTVTTQTKAGPVRYVQLAHNRRNPETGRSETKILYNFGREDALDRAAVARLARSILRYLAKQDRSDGPGAEYGSSSVNIEESREIGGTWLLHGLWQQLGLERVLSNSCDRLLFAAAAWCCLDPEGKETLEQWGSRTAAVPEPPLFAPDSLQSALECAAVQASGLQEQIAASTANLFNRSVELLFVHSDWGILGFAVTGDGQPVQYWTWSASVVDTAMIEQARSELLGWTAADVFVSEPKAVERALHAVKFVKTPPRETADPAQPPGPAALERNLRWLLTGHSCRFGDHMPPGSGGLYWLALLLLHRAETQTAPWPQIRPLLQPVAIRKHRWGETAIWQTMPLKRSQAEIFKALKIPLPPQNLISLDEH